MTHKLKLFVAPGSCARVPTIALEEIGVPFKTELIRMVSQQYRSPEYLAINPKGKVPTLLIDDQVLTENVAINSWLHRTYPEAKLLPHTDDVLEQQQQIADLSFFAATVHPLVTRIAMPMAFTDEGDPFQSIRPKGIAAMNSVMAMINDRLKPGGWWYGDQWSIVDGYLFWAWWRVGVVGFPQEAFPNIIDHAARSVERPSVARAMAREAVNIEILKAEGLYRAPR